MKYLLLTTLLLFTGCGSDLSKAKQQVACLEHSGVFSYSDFGPLKCNDGTTIKGLNHWYLTGPAVAEQLILLKDN